MSKDRDVQESSVVFLFVMVKFNYTEIYVFGLVLTLVSKKRPRPCRGKHSEQISLGLGQKL